MPATDWCAIQRFNINAHSIHFRSTNCYRAAEILLRFRCLASRSAVTGQGRQKESGRERRNGTSRFQAGRRIRSQSILNHCSFEKFPPNVLRCCVALSVLEHILQFEAPWSGKKGRAKTHDKTTRPRGTRPDQTRPNLTSACRFGGNAEQNTFINFLPPNNGLANRDGTA